MLDRNGSERGLREPEVAQRRPDGPHIASFALIAGLVRDTRAPNRIVIPARVDVVRLELNLEEDEYESYGAVLQTARGRDLWHRDRLKAAQTSSYRTVVLPAPAGLLADGDYIVVLRVRNRWGELQDVSEYSFRTLKH